MMWSKLSAGIVIIVAVFVLSGFQTDVLRANWKYAGDTRNGKENGHTLEFFDEENIQHLPNGDVRVWIRTIDAAEIDRLVVKEKEITAKAAEKMAKSYYPPYFLSNPQPEQDAEPYLEIIVWEEAANHPDILPRAKLHCEMRCRERMIQTVSAILYKSNNTTSFASDFDKWSSITPGSTGDTLRKILCK